MYEFRLEKIISGTNELYGYELLSRPEKLYGKCIESHFNEMSDIEHVTLLAEQVCYLRKFSNETISLNIEVRYLSNTSYMKLIKNELVAVCNENNLDICLELSERDLISIEDLRMISQLRDIKKNGFSIWLDDFGTGYSNLSTLLNNIGLIDLIKIDKSIFWSLNSRYKYLLNSLIEFMKQEGKKIVIEGIETEKHDLFRYRHNIFGQGYLYGVKE